jgi:hypothetical protein
MISKTRECEKCRILLDFSTPKKMRAALLQNRREIFGQRVCCFAASHQSDKKITVAIKVPAQQPPAIIYAFSFGDLYVYSASSSGFQDAVIWIFDAHAVVELYVNNRRIG